VAELASELGLTGNAIRGHLAALERDGLVEPRELRRGANKPSLTYGLTAAGEAAFPKAHGLVMGAILDELRARQSPADVDAFLHAVGDRLLNADTKGAGLEAAIEAFGRLGGAAQIEPTGTGLALHCHDCPLADVSREHAEPCAIVNAILERVLGVEVRTRCTRDDRPACRFEFVPEPHG
jgi:predicted ArsR family transcriptional regulator